MNDTWRNHSTHREESKAVKTALVAAGYTGVSVTHGTGTAWSWLEIHAQQKLGQAWEAAWRDILRIAHLVTGRTGDYEGEINVHLKEAL